MTRWPLHPAPLVGEALSSWLRRVAEHNGVDVPDLLADLGFAPGAEADVDLVPPPGFVDRVAQRTGVPAEHVRLMSAAGYVPWLADSLSPGQSDFSTYVRQFSVLLPHGRRINRTVDPWTPWRPQCRRDGHRFCRQCLSASPQDYHYCLFWPWPIMLTCPIHRTALEISGGAPGYYFVEPRVIPERVYAPDHPVTVMDSRTWQALTRGSVDLTEGRVHIGVWFRLMRTVIDELCATITECGAASSVVRAVWDEMGCDYRAGIGQWRTYEELPCEKQAVVLEAAATAMGLLESGELEGLGRDARLFPLQPAVEIDPGWPASLASVPMLPWRRIRLTVGNRPDLRRDDVQNVSPTDRQRLNDYHSGSGGICGVGAAKELASHLTTLSLNHSRQSLRYIE